MTDKILFLLNTVGLLEKYPRHERIGARRGVTDSPLYIVLNGESGARAHINDRVELISCSIIISFTNMQS